MQRNKLLVATTAVALCTLGIPSAGSASAARVPVFQPGSVAPNSGASVCQSTISKGSAASALKFCVTANGNIVQLAFRGIEQIRFHGFATEGYLLCVGGAVKAYDLADHGESGFQAPVITQPGGVNTLPLTITRTTTDGSLQLAQAYSAGLDSVSVATTVKNLTAATISAVKSFRWTDINAGGQTSNTFTQSFEAIAATRDRTTGLLMTTGTYSQIREVGVVGHVQFDTCAPGQEGTPVTADRSAFQTYDLANLAAHTSKSNTTIYRRI